MCTVDLLLAGVAVEAFCEVVIGKVLVAGRAGIAFECRGRLLILDRLSKGRGGLRMFHAVGLFVIDPFLVLGPLLRRDMCQRVIDLVLISVRDYRRVFLFPGEHEMCGIQG